MRPVTTSLSYRFVCRAHSLTVQLALLALSMIAMAAGLPDCHAGSFAVSPTRIELSDAQSRTVIQVDNPTAAPITIQLTVMAWSHPEGKEELHPSRDILATPQIITVQPRASQLVRVGALRKADPTRELAYRLSLDEIPAPPPPDFKGLQVVLKVGLPIFLKPAVDSKAKLAVSLMAAGPRQFNLRIANEGNGSAQLSDISLHPADAPETLLAKLANSIYVLAGQQRTVSLKHEGLDLDKTFLIKAATSSGPLQFHAIPVSK